MNRKAPPITKTNPCYQTFLCLFQRSKLISSKFHQCHYEKGLNNNQQVKE